MQKFIYTTLVIFLLAIIFNHPISLLIFNIHRKYLLKIENLNNRMESITQEFLIDSICKKDEGYYVSLIINDLDNPKKYEILVTEESYIRNLIVGEIIPFKISMLSVWYKSLNVIFFKFQEFGESDYFNIIEINEAEKIALSKIKEKLFLKSMRLVLGIKGEHSTLINEIST